jgi:hypothetical protein
MQTTKDLAEADRRRRQEFKEYEMEKKFEEEQKMKGNTGNRTQNSSMFAHQLYLSYKLYNIIVC